MSGAIDYEFANSYNITIQAESTDGSSDANDFQIDVLNDIRDDLQNYSQTVRVDIGKKLSQLDISDSSFSIFNSSNNNHIYEYANPNVTIVDAQQIADDYLLGSKYSGHILTIDNEQERRSFLWKWRI